MKRKIAAGMFGATGGLAGEKPICSVEICDWQRSSPEPLEGSTDSKTLDYQRTNSWGYQIVRTHTKETTGI